MLESWRRLKQEVVYQTRSLLQCLIKYCPISSLLSKRIIGRVVLFEFICDLEILFQILCDSYKLRSLLIEHLLFVLKLPLNLVYSQVSLSFCKHIQFLLMQCLQFGVYIVLDNPLLDPLFNQHILQLQQPLPFQPHSFIKSLEAVHELSVLLPVIELRELPVLLNRHDRIVVVFRRQLHLLYLLSEACLVLQAAQRPRDWVLQSLVQLALPEQELRVFFLSEALLEIEFTLSPE